MLNRLIFAIDNSMDFLTIAIALDGNILEKKSLKSRRHPSEIIAVETEELLVRNGFSLHDITRIIVTLGPGSFTGIRVALSYCRGLRAGSSVPVTGVPTLDVLASPFSFLAGSYVCPLIDAKKGEVFTALYHSDGKSLERCSKYLSMRPRELRDIIKTPCVVFGTGVALSRDVLTGIDSITLISEGFQNPGIEDLLREGLRRSGESQEDLQPIYGRKSEAEIKFNVTLS